MTLDDVKHAKQALAAAGQRPTLTAVLAQLGRGSKRDVARLMRALDVEEAPTAAGPPAPASGAAPATAVLRLPQASTQPRLTFAQVVQAARALQQQRARSLWTQHDTAPTPERVLAWCDQHCRYQPPLALWELWSTLQPHVTDPDDAALLGWYIRVLRRGEYILNWHNSHTQHHLQGMWARLLETPSLSALQP